MVDGGAVFRRGHRYAMWTGLPPFGVNHSTLDYIH